MSFAYSGSNAWAPNDSVKKIWGWSISEHLSTRKMRLCQIHTRVVSVNLVFFNCANVVTWLHTARKQNKNGNTFCYELLNQTGLVQCVMQASTKLCLAFFEFFTVWENEGLFFFQLDPVPQGSFIRSYAFTFKYLKQAKHKSDILKARAKTRQADGKID